MSKFKIEVPFETRPPRLKDMVDQHIMGDVWIRDTPFGPVTDSLRLAENFGMSHKNVLRAIDKCKKELLVQLKFELNQNLLENSYLGGAEGYKRKTRKVDITEFGLALLLLYINTPKARQISAEIIYRFFIMKSYLAHLKPNQLNALKGFYRRKMKSE